MLHVVLKCFELFWGSLVTYAARFRERPPVKRFRRDKLDGERGDGDGITGYEAKSMLICYHLLHGKDRNFC